MKRTLILGAIVVVGGLSMGVAAWQGQQAPAPSAQALTVDKVKDNLFIVRGGGGNTAVFITSTGVVVVDAKNPGFGQPILDKIKELTPKPVTMLINTHSHQDHVSGNVEFPATIDVIAQERTKANMEKMPIFATNQGRGLVKHAFKDKMTIGKGADQIDLFFFGPGHTGGDAWVLFPALHTVHAGDMFASKGFPLVDGDTGGSMIHFAETLRKAHAGIKGADTIINGHLATTTTWDDLRTFSEFVQDFTTWAEGELKAGKTPEQIAADWKLPEKYRALGYSSNVAPNFGGLAGRVQLLANELKTK